jgi:hypothetical protein
MGEKDLHTKISLKILKDLKALDVRVCISDPHLQACVNTLQVRTPCPTSHFAASQFTLTTCTGRWKNFEALILTSIALQSNSSTLFIM